MAILVNFGFYDGMIDGLLSSSNGFLGNIVGDRRIEIYSGTMPPDADDWVQGGDSSPVNLLATYSTFTVEQAANVDVTMARFSVSGTPSPSTVNASATGTAAWYAMYATEEQAEFGALLGDVTLSGGNGSLHLDSLTLVSGNPVQLVHWGLQFTS